MTSHHPLLHNYGIFLSAEKCFEEYNEKVRYSCRFVVWLRKRKREEKKNRHWEGPTRITIVVVIVWVVGKLLSELGRLCCDSFVVLCCDVFWKI